jgi:hypothetical protein
LIVIKLFSTKILKKKDFSIKYKNKKWKNYYKYIYNNTFKNKNLNFLNYKNKF